MEYRRCAESEKREGYFKVYIIRKVCSNMKKIFSVSGMVVGIVAIIFALGVLTGQYSDVLSSGGSSPYSSGYASFGGDYYTYSVNNSAEAASAAKAAASNVGDVYELLELCFGWFMLIFGMVTVCGFGIVFAECFVKKVVNEANEKIKNGEAINEENTSEEALEELAEETDVELKEE